MLNPFFWAFVSSLCLFFRIFHSSYRHPSILVAEPFFADFRASSTLASVISQLMGKFSGSFSFWASGITLTVDSVCVVLIFSSG